MKNVLNIKFTTLPVDAVRLTSKIVMSSVFEDQIKMVRRFFLKVIHFSTPQI